MSASPTAEIDEFEAELVYPMLAHEIATPITIISGFAEMMDEGLAGELTEPQRLYVAQIREKAEDISLLISSLLDFVKIQHCTLVLNHQEIVPAEFLAQFTAAFQLLASRRGVSVTYRTPPLLPMLEADPLRLRQVLNNLLTNALKFTPVGGSVVLGADRHPLGLSFSVSDTGPGISEDTLARLLRGPFRMRPSDHGIGVGLSIARHLVEAHGGRLEASSRYGQGTTFMVTLPLSPTGVCYAAG